MSATTLAPTKTFASVETAWELPPLSVPITATLITATAIFIFTDGKLSGDNWVDLVKWTSGFYFVANAASKWGRHDG